MSGEQQAKEQQKAAATKSKIEAVLVKLSEVKPEKVEWLWQDRFPLGKISLIVGNPGLGKSFLSLCMAAHVTTGRPWPDAKDMRIEQGSVLVMTDEDDLADTVRVRLDAAGADPTRVVAVKGVKVRVLDGREVVGFFDLKRCMPALEDAVEKTGDVRLIILDPIAAYMGDINSNDNAEVRGVLSPLADFAAKHRIAVLGIHHLNKNTNVEAAYRIMGSVAFVAASRTVWYVLVDKEDEERRKLLPGKNNLAKNPKGLAFRLRSVKVGLELIDSAVCEFESEVLNESVDDALDSGPGDRRAPKRIDEAADWLREFLSDGPKSSKDVWEEAERRGIKEKTLNRAKTKVGICHLISGSGKSRESKWELLE